MDWNETEGMLEKLHRDLNQSWEDLRAIAKHETFTDSISTEKKMKSAKFLTEAAERTKVLQVVHRRVVNRIRRLYLYMGMNPSQAESQRVRNVYKTWLLLAIMKRVFLFVKTASALAVPKSRMLQYIASICCNVCL